MPRLAATPPSSSATAAAAAAVPTAGRVAFRRPWSTPRPEAPRLRLRLRARGVRREDGGGVRTEEQEQEREQMEMAPRTFYDLLGISAEGSPDDVRAAYRRLALKYHPDVSPPGAAAENTRRFIEVQEAYETLSDPSRRASYDRALARGVCRLAFSGRRSQSYRAYYHHHQEQEEKSGWRRSWEDQIEELKKRSMTKDSEENLSWGARMRRRAEASSAEQL